MEGLLIIIDIIIMGILAFFVIKAILGDVPLGRIFGVVGGIAGALLYGSLASWVCFFWFKEAFMISV